MVDGKQTKPQRTTAKKRKTKKKSLRSPLYPVLIGLCLSMFLLSVLLPDSAYSSVENRPLKQNPIPSWQTVLDGSCQTDSKIWFADQFPARNLFFHLNYLVRKACGQREIQDVFLGNDALQANPEAPENDALNRNLNAVAELARLTDLKTVSMIVPSSATVQPQKLPAFAAVRNPASDFQTISDFMQAHPQVMNIEIASILQEHARDPIYYKTDHHWTTQGAGLGAQALLNALSLPVDLSAYETIPVSSSFEGTLASRTGSVFLKDTIELAVAHNNPDYLVTWADQTKATSIYVQEALRQKDQYQVFLGANQSKIQIETDADTDRTLLLFKDSYANSVIQYLLPYFSSITVIDPRYFYDDLQTVLDASVFTDIAVLYSCDTFVTVSSFADLIDGWVAGQSVPEAAG